MRRFSNPEFYLAAVAVRGAAGARHDNILGRAVLHAHAGHARCRGYPRRIDAAARRHPLDRGYPDHRRTVVGEVADLLRAQYEQEGSDTRPAERGGTRTSDAVDRDL